MVIDGLPVVHEDSMPKLVKFLLKKLNSVGKTREDAIFMPLDEKKNSQGYGFWNKRIQISLTYEVLHLLNTNTPFKRLLPQNPFMALP